MDELPVGVGCAYNFDYVTWRGRATNLADCYIEKI